MKSARQTIAVDVDDVLSVTFEALIKFSNKRWEMNLSIDDYDEDWMKLWKVDSAGLVERTEVVRNEFWQTIEHIEEAWPVLNRLADKYKLIITTSRRTDLSGQTKEWIDKYFNGIFEEIHHSGIFDIDKSNLELYKKATIKTKARLCKEVGADYLIDDHLKHCLAVDSLGIKAILFGDYPWNQAAEMLSTITRVRNWSEVEEYFARQK